MFFLNKITIRMAIFPTTYTTFFLQIQYIIVYFLAAEMLTCKYCYEFLPNDAEIIADHCKFCSYKLRPDKTYIFTCFACEYHSAKRSHIKEHIRQHTGEKPFSCLLCEYKAAKKSNLTKHMSKKHPSSYEDPFFVS